MIFCPFHERRHAKPCFLQRYKRKIGYRAKARRLSRRRERARLAAVGLIAFAVAVGYAVGGLPF